jgi:hypothetical protein
MGLELHGKFGPAGGVCRFCIVSVFCTISVLCTIRVFCTFFYINLVCLFFYIICFYTV